MQSETDDLTVDDRPMTDDRVEDARTLLLSLAVALRSIGKATSVDRMTEFGRSYPAAEKALSGLSEVLPRQTGRMLSDLLLEFPPKEGPSLRAEVFDPRSFREAADAVELVADRAPDEVLLAYAALPEERWPREQICDAGLFLLGLVLRGISSVHQRDGLLQIADASISVQNLLEARDAILGWHRAFATAAGRTISHPPPPEGFGALLPSIASSRPTVLPKTILLTEEQAALLSSFVKISEEGDVAFRRMVAASLFVFLRLLQRPYAVVFQSLLRFEPADGRSSFSPPSTVFVGTDGDLWQVVRALAVALDWALGGYSGPSSISVRSIRAFGEAVSAGTPYSASDGFTEFMVAYLQVLVAQQGVLDKAETSDRTWVDRKTVSKLHAQFLELLLDEQKRALFEEGRRVGAARTTGLIEGSAGAASLPLLAWLLPKVG